MQNVDSVLEGVQALSDMNNTEDDEETEELVDFSDVDYEDDDMEDERLGKTNPLSASKTHWGEDSK